jgi:predicted nuclease with TOPRIM domain
MDPNAGKQRKEYTPLRRNNAGSIGEGSNCKRLTISQIFLPSYNYKSKETTESLEKASRIKTEAVDEVANLRGSSPREFQEHILSAQKANDQLKKSNTNSCNENEMVRKRVNSLAQSDSPEMMSYSKLNSESPMQLKMHQVFSMAKAQDLKKKLRNLQRDQRCLKSEVANELDKFN